MKNWIGASVALCALAAIGSAQAADLASQPSWTKAPVLPPVSTPWTGFYTGLGLGFRSTQNDLTTTSIVFDGPQDLSGLALTQPFNSAGFRANPYVGYNWQVGRQWVVGIEGDVGFGDQTTTLPGFNFSPGSGSGTDGADSLAVKTTWDASLRGRAGYLLTPSTLVYATGGLAWQHDDVISTCAGNFCSSSGLAPAVVTNSVTRTGWTVGGGIETVLWGNWLARAEYRYADFGTAAMNITRTETGLPSPTFDTFDARLRTHLASFGVAYKFGDHPAASDSIDPIYPVKAPAGATSWSGLYVGLSAGARATQASVFDAFESQEGFTFNNLLNRPRTQPFDGTSALVSPYIGYNFQIAPRWIVGIEGDVGFANQTATREGFTTIALKNDQSPAQSTTVKATWDASLRGRVGYLVMPTTLLYATGGVAWQHFEFDSNCLGQVCANTFELTPAVIDQSATKAGGTVGAGFETELWRHWLLRGEYRYADYGHSSFTVTRNSPISFFNPTTNISDVALRTHTASFGLTYKFD
jgi:outer membrane immunogenic protein